MRGRGESWLESRQTRSSRPYFIGESESPSQTCAAVESRKRSKRTLQFPWTRVGEPPGGWASPTVKPSRRISPLAGCAHAKPLTPSSKWVTHAHPSNRPSDRWLNGPRNGARRFQPDSHHRRDAEARGRALAIGFRAVSRGSLLWCSSRFSGRIRFGRVMDACAGPMPRMERIRMARSASRARDGAGREFPRKRPSGAGWWGTAVVTAACGTVGGFGAGVCLEIGEGRRSR